MERKDVSVLQVFDFNCDVTCVLCRLTIPQLFFQALRDLVETQLQNMKVTVELGGSLAPLIAIFTHRATSSQHSQLQNQSQTSLHLTLRARPFTHHYTPSKHPKPSRLHPSVDNNPSTTAVAVHVASNNQTYRPYKQSTYLHFYMQTSISKPAFLLFYFPLKLCHLCRSTAGPPTASEMRHDGRLKS